MPINPSCKVDAHVHLTGPEALQSLRVAGISAVRDAGTKTGAGLTLAGGSPDLRIQSAGRALSRKGGYGGMFGTPLDSDDAIRREIKALANAGAGIIKVMASGIVSLTEPGKITDGGFDADQLRTVVSEASALCLSVMAHANGEDAILNAARAGVRSIEHGFFMTGQALDELATRGIWWVPTAGALERAARKADDVVQRAIAEIVSGHLSMIKKAYERGVKLALGTDAVLPDPAYPEYYEAELELFRTAGIPDVEAANIACRSGRELLGG